MLLAYRWPWSTADGHERSLGSGARRAARRRPGGARPARAPLPRLRARRSAGPAAAARTAAPTSPRATDAARSRRRLLYAGAARLVLVAAIAVPIVAGLRDDAAGERERAAAAPGRARGRRARAADARRPPDPRRRARRCAADADPLAHRAALVDRGRDADHRRRPRARRRRRRSTATSRARACEPFPTTAERRAAETDPATQRRPLRLRRVHVEVRGAGGRGPATAPASSATPTGSWSTTTASKLVWCKVTPRAGEGGRSLASVPGARSPAGTPRAPADPLRRLGRGRRAGRAVVARRQRRGSCPSRARRPCRADQGPIFFHSESSRAGTTSQTMIADDVEQQPAREPGALAVALAAREVGRDDRRDASHA